MTDRFEDFTSYINRAYKYILKIKTHEMKAFGLKAAHVMCLFYIGKYEDGLTASELVTLAIEDKAAVSKVLSELKAADLITADDNNGKKIYRTKYLLTEKGTKIHSRISEIIRHVVEEGGRGLSDEERIIFYRALSLIVNNLQKYADEL